MNIIKKTVLLGMLTLAIIGCSANQFNSISNKSISVEEKSDIKYISESSNFFHTADLYIPQGQKNYPVVLFIHGGNWNSQEKNYFNLFTGLYGNVGKALAKRGIGTLVINYRKTPEVNIEGMLSDIVASLDWIVGNIQKYNGDPNNIFLAGHSAGSHLATLTGVKTDITDKNGLNKRLRGIISMSPVINLKLVEATSSSEYNESVTYKVFGRAESDLIKYSPITYFSKDTLPIFFVVGEKDYSTIVSESAKAIETFKSFGVDNTRLELKGLDHGGVILSIDKSNDLISDPVAKFVFDNVKK